jgi:hypothetical protein
MRTAVIIQVDDGRIRADGRANGEVLQGNIDVTTHHISSRENHAGIARSRDLASIRAGGQRHARRAVSEISLSGDPQLAGEGVHSRSDQNESQDSDDNRPHVRSLAQLQFVPPSLFGVELPIR